MRDRGTDPASPGRRAWVVMKFGGTSVATASGWEGIAGAIRATLRKEQHPLVVCSAVGGVSDLLERLARTALAGDDPAPVLQVIEDAHRRLADELGVDLAPVTPHLEALAGMAQGVAMTREASPRLRARMMAQGELMSTRLGVAWLDALGLPVAWVDARELLAPVEDPSAPDERRYLSATCDHAPDPALRARLEGLAPAVVTQGFIAGDAQGDTVLLGRGGSDTSAAYLGARLGARRVEIWTDVPGMFSANPRVAADARLLRRLSYAEAEILATMGGKVLHPRCVAPCRDTATPLHVRCTYAPQLDGTAVQPVGGQVGVKAVSVRKGLSLVEVRRPATWQPVGFLADVAGCFQRHGLSIDLTATSPGRILATVDPSAAPHAERALEALLADLSEVSEPSLRRRVASVSLVGSGLRTELERLAPVLRLADAFEVLMVSQGADDTHLTLVVDDDRADELAAALHGELLAGVPRDETFGPAWRDLRPGVGASSSRAGTGEAASK